MTKSNSKTNSKTKTKKTTSRNGTDATGEAIATDQPTLPFRIEAPALYVDQSSTHGLGVFAGRAFDAEELIERCPVLVIPPEQAEAVAYTTLGDYIYEWLGGYAAALGYGSLYNHSRTSNGRYEMDYEGEELHIMAERRIKRGEEIFINYNGDPTDHSPVWFEL